MNSNICMMGKVTMLYIRGSKEANEYISRTGVTKFHRYFI